MTGVRIHLRQATQWREGFYGGGYPVPESVVIRPTTYPVIGTTAFYHEGSHTHNNFTGGGVVIVDIGTTELRAFGSDHYVICRGTGCAVKGCDQQEAS